MVLKTFDMHKYSESKNNLGQIDKSTRTRKELEAFYGISPICRKAKTIHVFFFARSSIGQPLVVEWQLLPVSNAFKTSTTVVSDKNSRLQNARSMVLMDINVVASKL